MSDERKPGSVVKPNQAFFYAQSPNPPRPRVRLFENELAVQSARTFVFCQTNSRSSRNERSFPTGHFSPYIPAPGQLIHHVCMQAGHTVCFIGTPIPSGRMPAPMPGCFRLLSSLQTPSPFVEISTLKSRQARNGKKNSHPEQ